MKKILGLMLAAAIAGGGLAGCGSSGGGDGPAFQDYTTGSAAVLGPVPATGEKTLQNGSADTHEVETDGKWIVWRGRAINVGYHDGAGARFLDLSLPGSVTAWAFNSCYDSPIDFDGTTLAFVGNDVADAGKVAFYYVRPGAAAKKIELPDADYHDTYNYGVYVYGNVAAVYEYDSETIWSADLGEAAPAFEVLDYSGSADEVGAGSLAIFDGGELAFLDLATLATTTMTGDDDPFTSPNDLRFANGTFTWVDGDDAFSFKPGVDNDSVLIYDTVNAQYAPLAGPDYFVWEEEGMVYYLADAAGSTPVALDGAPEVWDVEAGDGFLARLEWDENWNYQLFVYDLATQEEVQVTADEGAGSDNSLLRVDGDKAYFLRDFESLDNPSKVLSVYRHSTGAVDEVVGDRDFQQVATFAAAGGKAVFLTRDHSFRLFAKEAAATSRPVTLTPPGMMVEKFALTDGVLAFNAMDRLRYLDEDPTLLDEYSGSALFEIYYLNLNAYGTVQRVTDDLVQDYRPMTDGKYITWRNADGQLSAYEIAAGTVTVLGDAGQEKISIDDGIAVWRYSNSIYYYNLNTDESGTLYTGSSINHCPDIANGVVAWVDNFEVMYYDFNADDPQVVAIEGSRASYDYWYYDWWWGYYHNEYQSPVSTDGNYLTWRTHRAAWDPDGEGTDYEEMRVNVVVVYDIATQTASDIPAADWTQTGTDILSDEAGNNGPVCNPRISGGLVVFAANEYGEDNPDIDKEIFYYDLNADTPALVRLTDDPDGEGLWDSQPAVAGGLIVWRTGGSDEWDWRGKTPAAARIP